MRLQFLPKAVFLTLIISFSEAKPLALHTRHSSRVLPSGFVETGSPSDATLISIRVGLKAADNAGLEQKLYEVSTPGSGSYGQYLSRDQVRSYAAPSSDSVTAVTSWLESQNIFATITGAFNEYLSFNIPVSKANDLLNAKYTNFTYTSSSETWALYTYSYSIPEDLLEHISLVHPANSFAPPLSRSGRIQSTFYPSSQTRRASDPRIVTRANSAPASCETLVPPSCLQALYGIPSEPATQSTNRLGVGSPQSNWAEEADLEAFLTEYRPDMSPNTTFTLVSVANGTNPQSPFDGSFEASLDVQYTIGVATDVPTDFISVGDILTDIFTAFTDLAEYLNTADNPPQVITV
jgi:tripeptidyl-peptidase I